ncbi:MAG: HEAT repeat domain-containing protein, partial [Candidatus Hydrogenedentes bacterium]|nr:HEAT repeat domain-containing protein [Candidatus Hydrogenedentota bacterium]
FRSTKPLEELYDTESDPHELYNLAESPEYSDPLASLRAALDRWLDESNDLGFVPETELDRFVPAQNPDLTASRRTSYSMNESGDSVFGLSHRIMLKDLNSRNRLRRYRAIKTLGLADGPEIEVLLVAALNDNDVCVASLAASALGNTKKQDAKISEALRGALQHTSPAIKLAAAQSLVRLGNKEVALPVAMQSMKDPDIFVRLASAQILEMIEPKTEEIRDLLIHAKDDKSDPRDYVADVARRALGLPPQH